MLRRKLAQVRQIFDCKRLGLGTQVTQKADDLIGRIGHFRYQGQFAKTGKPQQPGFFKTKRKDFLNQACVVQLQRIGQGLIGRPGNVGAVEFFP